MLFRPITVGLLDTALDIMNSNPHYNTIENGNPIRTIDDARQEFLNPDTESYLVFHEDAFIGIIDFLAHNPNDHSPWIGLFMIHGDYHSRGYGKMVYSLFEKRLKQQRYSKVRIGILQGNTAVEGFWTALGFQFYAYKPWKDKTIGYYEKKLL